MDDENGLELSLGLGLGGSSSKLKCKNGSTSKLDSGSSSPVNESGKPDTNVVINLNNEGQKASNKRKMPFGENSNLKKPSHISITEDGSTAENEDVAESEVDGSTSRLVNRLDDGPKSNQFIGVRAHSEVAKEIIGLSDSRRNDSLGNEIKQGNFNYGVQFSVQPANIANRAFPIHMKEVSSAGVTSTSVHTQPANQSVNPGNLPMMFGYSPIQLPTLDKENSWGMVYNLQQFQPSFAGRGPPNSAIQLSGQNVSEPAQFDTTASERAKGEGKHHITEEGSASHTDDDRNRSTANLRALEAERPPAEGSSFDPSVIRPGVSPDVKFGGSGSYPNLPWVSTTGTGSNGRTISGVTYRYSADQIRIVCACHGSHMSPEEFVQHANEENPDTANGLSVFTGTNNPAASSQS